MRASYLPINIISGIMHQLIKKSLQSYLANSYKNIENLFSEIIGRQ